MQVTVTEKVVLASKKLISTSERHVEHPFADQNTQHVAPKRWSKHTTHL